MRFVTWTKYLVMAALMAVEFLTVVAAGAKPDVASSPAGAVKNLMRPDGSHVGGFDDGTLPDPIARATRLPIVRDRGEAGG